MNKKKCFVLIIFVLLLTSSIVTAKKKKIIKKKVGGITFIKINAGTFLMGSLKNKGYLNEYPRHRVRLKSYWIAQTEITQDIFKKIMGYNPSVNRGAKRPVEQVTWNEAVKFCKKFNKKYNVAIRLPTEAEWEKAARAGTTTLYYWGNKFNGDYCWFHDNSRDLTFPVKSKKANKWGLYDMSGNVNEWCSDYYSDNYYSDIEVKNPKGPEEGIARVIRGGSWFNNYYNQRAGFRSSYSENKKNFYLGFRVAADRVTSP